MSDTIYRQQAIDAVNRINRTDNWKTAMIWALTSLPSAQPEITEDDVKEYCRKRCLIVVTSDFYDEMTRRWASAQSERKNGKWVSNGVEAFGVVEYWVCDQCYAQSKYRFNFCPVCGADMRGESDEML